MKMYLRYTIALLAFALSQSTVAATISFSGLGSVPSSGYSTTVDGITVTVTTPGANHLKYGTTGFFGSNGGLGSSGSFFDAATVGSGESLLVSFSEMVTVGSMSLAGWGFGDGAQVTSAGGNLSLSGGSGTFDLSSLGGISSFNVAASGFSPSFLLQGLGVQAAAVPVPAAGWLFMSALIGLAGKRRLSR